MQEIEQRKQAVTQARRIVVKLGTGLLVQRGGLHRARMRSFAKEIHRLIAGGKEVVLVSSGAVGAGMEVMGLQRRPKSLPDLQIAASVGQSHLMAQYASLFSRYNVTVGQVLITHDDLKQRKRHLNMRNTMLGLLRRQFLPIVNENDVISVDELKVGDNDVLASLITILIGADLLLLMTTSNGLRTSAHSTTRIPYVAEITPEILQLAEGKGSELSTGGMLTKLQAAQNVCSVGSSAIIADGRDPKNLQRIMRGEDVGTFIGKVAERPQSGATGRKRWIAFFHRPRGALVIDSGAVIALERKGNSLLAVGVLGVQGSFDVGDLVNVKSEDGQIVARGLVEYSSEQVCQIKGKHTGEFSAILGKKTYDEIIHRDNMLLLRLQEQR